MTREEFVSRQAAADALSRGYFWGIIYSIWLATVLAAIILVALLGFSFFTHADVRAERIAMLWELGCCVALFWGANHAFNVRARKVEQLTVRCTSCRRFVSRESEKSTLETGRCAGCGAQVIGP